MSKRQDSHSSLQKALMRPGDFHLRRDDRQMFGNYLEMSSLGGTVGLANVRRSAMVVETPVYDSARLWQINLQFSGPRATPAVLPSPWVPALGAPFDLVKVTLRAALDRDKATVTMIETLTPLDGLLLGNGVAAFQQRFQAGVQIGLSVEITGPNGAVLGVQASIVEVEAGERDPYDDAIVNGNGTPAGTPFPQTTATQTFLLPNARRRQFFVQNWGTAPLFIQFGQGANGPSGGPPSWTIALPARGDIYESLRDCWQGYVTGIWAAASLAATDFAMVTEGT